MRSHALSRVPGVIFAFESVVVTLAPAGDKVTVHFDSASGASEMSGTTTKKK